MRILHYHRNIRLEKGGVVRFVLDLCGALASRGHHVTLASPDLTDIPDSWTGTHNTPWTSALPRSMSFGDRLGARAARSAGELVETHDVVHLHGAWMPSNVQIAAMCRMSDRPYVVTPHGMLDDWCTAQSALKKKIFHAFSGRAFLRGASMVHCTAEYEEKQSRPWFAPTPSRVIPPVIDLAPFDGPVAPPPADAPLLFLSRLHPKKRPELLIDACVILKRRGIVRRVVIAGTGDPEYVQVLRDRARNAGLERQIEFPGHVTGEAKAALYRSAGVFILPTSQENFGLVLVEALASGVPVITTRGVDIWPELERSGGVELVEPEAMAIADAAMSILQDASRRGAMSAAGRSWSRESFDAARIVEKYVMMYEAVRV